MASDIERRDRPRALSCEEVLPTLVSHERRRGPKKGLPTKWAVMLRLCERARLDERGNAHSRYPAAELAESLGLSESQVHGATRALRSEGLISLKEGATGGRAASYWIFPGHHWSAAGTAEPPRPETGGRPWND